MALVDLDAHGNLAPCLGLKPSPGLYRLLLDLAPLGDLLLEVRPNLWLLPGDSATAKAKAWLATESYRETILAKALPPLDVDFCVLDTGPSRDVMHDGAHHAADEVICPVAVDMLALIGVAQEMETLQVVREHGHDVTMLAILPTLWDPVTKESATNLELLARNYGPLVLPAIPRTVRLREAPAYGRTLWEQLKPDHRRRWPTNV